MNLRFPLVWTADRVPRTGYTSRPWCLHGDFQDSENSSLDTEVETWIHWKLEKYSRWPHLDTQHSLYRWLGKCQCWSSCLAYYHVNCPRRCFLWTEQICEVPRIYLHVHPRCLYCRWVFPYLCKDYQTFSTNQGAAQLLRNFMACGNLRDNPGINWPDHRRGANGCRQTRASVVVAARRIDGNAFLNVGDEWVNHN